MPCDQFDPDPRREPTHPAHATVLIISGSVGAGHDGAAAELGARLRAAGVSVEIRDYLQALPRPARTVLRRGYTGTIRSLPAFLEWLFTQGEHASWMHRLIQALCWSARRRVRGWAQDASLVVSTFPFASQTLGQLKQAGVLAVPTVTYLTDPAPHRVWVHPAVDHHLTVTEFTAMAGRRYGVPMRAVGGLVPSAFSRARKQHERDQVRRSLGVPAGHPVALVAAGSAGMGAIPATIAALTALANLYVVVLCGRNEQLRREIGGHERVLALGWRRDIPDLMAAADVLVHNAGGLTLTEAMSAGLPAITFHPIPGHGRANARILERSGLARWPRDEASLVADVDRQCAAGRRAPGAVSAGQDASSVVQALLFASAFGQPTLQSNRYDNRPDVAFDPRARQALCPERSDGANRVRYRDMAAAHGRDRDQAGGDGTGTAPQGSRRARDRAGERSH